MNYFNDVPDFVIDGIIDNKIEDKSSNNPHQICIENNSGASFLNLDAANDFENMTTDLGHYNCSLPVINHTVYP